MEKPLWRRRASTFVVDSPYMRLRVDEVELPDGTVIPQYFVRESDGFAVVFPVTDDGRIVLVRQYRYGSDALHLELPAGTLDSGEDAAACAARELAEETGYAGTDWEFLGTYYAEPVRSTAKAHVFLATGCRKASEPKLDAAEAMETELATYAEFREMLRDGRMDASHALLAGYRVMDYLGKL